MTEVGFIIQPGESIPDDVTQVDDRVGDVWEPYSDQPDSWRCVRYRGDPYEAGDPWHRSALAGAWGPLTVTAVREQPAEPEPDLLDLVRQYGTECLAQGAAAQRGSAPDQFHAKQAAHALLARIEAEVNRLRAEVDRLNAEADRVTDDLVQARDERDAQRLRADDAVDSLDRHREAWEAEVERLKAAAPDPSAPLVLSLPTVPDGAALVGIARWVRAERDPAKWVMEDEAPVRMMFCTCEVVAREGGSVTVVMREPRTWPQFEAEPADLPAVVEVSGHRWVRDGADFYHVSTLMMADRRFNDLRLFGDVVEVFDDKDGTPP